MADKAAASDAGSHEFVALHDDEVEWQEGDNVNELIALPPGVKVKIFNYDPVMKRVDMKVKFPPGYVEPEHSHKSWHSIVVLGGRMCVAGKDLRPGDYVFGGDVPHGPYEYPDGCEVYCVFMGEGTQHEWDESKHLAYENEWAAETDDGKAGVAAQKAARASGKVSADS
jgi:quercetin dioxygenase-like cupin family protein